MNDYEFLAYRMEEAYNNTHSQGEAVERVKNEVKDADVNILWAMWNAIDAYVDYNVQSANKEKAF